MLTTPVQVFFHIHGSFFAYICLFPHILASSYILFSTYVGLFSYIQVSFHVHCRFQPNKGSCHRYRYLSVFLSRFDGSFPTRIGLFHRSLFAFIYVSVIGLMLHIQVFIGLFPPSNTPYIYRSAKKRFRRLQCTDKPTAATA